MSFIVFGKPQGKARARTFYNPKNGKMQSITPENTVLYENQVKQAYLESGDDKYFDGEPLNISISAFYELPKSMTKADKDAFAAGELFPTKKPDADNIAKVICDALNGVAYHDDTQIINLYVHKIYTMSEPHVTVKLSKIL